MDPKMDLLLDFTTFFSLFYPLLYLRSFVSQNKAFKIFTLHLILIGILQIAQVYVIKVLKMESNLFLSHYYFILQFILLSLFYYQLLRFKWIYVLLAITMVFLAYQYIDNPALYYRYNTFGMIVTFLVIILYALLYLYKSLQGKMQFTIANIALFIYLSSTVLIFASGNLAFDLEISPEMYRLLFDLNQYLFLAFQILIFVEWWKNYSIPKARQ